MSVKHAFTPAETRRITAAIEAAEQTTSGEIRVFIDKVCDDDVVGYAAFVFEKIGMHKTDARNGVMIYLALESRRFAVIGDSGIHQKVGDEFWHAVRTMLQHHFLLGDFVTGLEKGIEEIGRSLSTYFPYQENDRNELNNDIVYGLRDDA